MHAVTAAFLALRARFRLSIYTELFGVFFGSGGDAWRHPRNLAGTEAIGKMPTMGRSR
jgi:hypothetical protein